MFILKQILKLLIQVIFSLKLDNYIIKLILRNKTLVICYHNVVKDYPSEFQESFKLFVTKKIFEKQILLLKTILDIKHENTKYIKKKLIITFDDGYKESFQNTLTFLNKNGLEPIYFLNMYSIKLSEPIISSLVIYLEDNDQEFINYCQVNNINKPAYLYITPEKLFKYLKKNISVKYKKITDYQGNIITYEQLLDYKNKYKFKVGNHLYNHFNTNVLTTNEFNENISKNNLELETLNNYFKDFAFPNGIPILCFKKKHVKQLKDQNFRKIYFSSNSLYDNNGLKDRIVLDESDDNIYKIKKKILNGFFISLYYLYIKML